MPWTDVVRKAPRSSTSKPLWRTRHPASVIVCSLNLKDIESGRGQCRERRIREAQRSAMQFAAVLNELLALGDPDALTVFLTHCDIPLINAVRPYVFQRLHPHWEGTDVWRTLSDRDLRAYAFPARRRARLL